MATFTKCGKVIKPWEIRLVKEFWQIFESSDGTFTMFNAYYDDREFYKTSNQSVVKIMAMVNRVNPTVKLHSQLWFDGLEEPVISEDCKFHVSWPRKWGANRKGSEPVFIICQNPLAPYNLVPSSISVLESQCDIATNNLKVIDNSQKFYEKKNFGVCARLYHYEHFNDTLKLVEWIEHVLILGADKIIFHIIDVHPKILKVLKFYQVQEKVKIERMTIPDELLKENIHSRNVYARMQTVQNQMIALNDCLYKYMYDFNFLVPLDIDELIVPSRNEDKTWGDILDRVIVKGRKMKPSYTAVGAFFLTNNNHQNEIQKNIPSNFFFLQKIYRSENFLKPNNAPKSFQNTAEVEVMLNHFPMNCLRFKVCPEYHLQLHDAKLHHYKDGCPRYLPENCNDWKNNTVRDETLWKYKDEIIENVNGAIKAIKTFHLDGML